MNPLPMSKNSLKCQAYFQSYPSFLSEIKHFYKPSLDEQHFSPISLRPLRAYFRHYTSFFNRNQPISQMSKISLKRHFQAYFQQYRISIIFNRNQPISQIPPKHSRTVLQASEDLPKLISPTPKSTR